MHVEEQSLADLLETGELTSDDIPNQGQWSIDAYLALDTVCLVEYTDGYLEVLPMPTTTHQFIMLFLYRALYSHVMGRALGEVLVPPTKVRIATRRFREPDVLFIPAARMRWQSVQYWQDIALAMEVVSPDDPQRDYRQKRLDYAAAGIEEYWIVDPQKEVVTVLQLQVDTSVLRGEFRPGTMATSALLPEFTVDVTALFAAAPAHE